MSGDLYVVASNILRTSPHLGALAGAPVQLERAILVTMEEKRWARLKGGIEAAIRSRGPLETVRIAGHLSTCFEVERTVWQERFPNHALELAGALGAAVPRKLEIWGFGHDPGCAIWSALSRMGMLLRQGNLMGNRQFPLELADAFRQETGKVSLQQWVAFWRHAIPGAGTTVSQNIQTALDGGPDSYFGEAEAILPIKIAGARYALTELSGLADRVADEGRRERARAAIGNAQIVLDSPPPISRTAQDRKAFLHWEEMLRTAAAQLTEDLFAEPTTL